MIRIPSITVTTLLVIVLGCLTFILRDSRFWINQSSPSGGSGWTTGNKWGLGGGGSGQNKHPPVVDSRYMVPKELIDLGVYDPESDFENEFGIRPTYWKPNNTASWGPCYPPRGGMICEWHNASDTEEEDNIRYNQNPPHLTASDSARFHNNNKKPQPTEKGGGCRPGFLIIGAGKCGTSSLYHYLTGHPRVLPAFEKQIHYFRYHLMKTLGWYYSFFPTTQSFLQHGALMTGEASPGYLPYPSVVQAVQRLMRPTLPKIIVIGREPLDRMYSSYKYNYVIPTIKLLQRGRRSDIPSHHPDDFYTPYLFSLEDFVRTELKQLRACLYGFGSTVTYDKWQYQSPFRTFVKDRFVANNTNATIPPPLIDLEEFCYGRQVNDTVYRPHWAELQMNNPNKVIFNFDLHLKQALIGRSLYTFPLEWWYLVYPPNDIYFVCTEELSDPDTLNDLALHLGLPSYNFSSAVALGAYNVAGHKGYDSATSWEDMELEGKLMTTTTATISSSSSSSSILGDGTEAAESAAVYPVSSTTVVAHGTDPKEYASTNGIPLPEDLFNELKDFIEPINERLFALIGKRCKW
jgi:hypothetical protein